MCCLTQDLFYSQQPQSQYYVFRFEAVSLLQIELFSSSLRAPVGEHCASGNILSKFMHIGPAASASFLGGMLVHIKSQLRDLAVRTLQDTCKSVT